MERPLNATMWKNTALSTNGKSIELNLTVVEFSDCPSSLNIALIADFMFILATPPYLITPHSTVSRISVLQSEY